jgi:cell division protein FtsN
MAQITMDKKALAILGMILAFLGLALFAAGLFSGLLMREAVSRPDAASVERQLAEVNSRLEEATRRAPTPAPEPAPTPAPTPEPAKAEPAKPAPAPEPAKAEPAKPVPAPVLPPPVPTRPVPAPGAGYVVQTGAFTVKMNAVNQAERLKEKGHNPAVVEVKGKSDRAWFVVRILGFSSLEEAQAAASQLLEREGIKAVAMEADFPMSPLQEEAESAEEESPAKTAAKPAAKAAAKATAEPAPPPSGKTRHSVQVSSFRDEKDADTTLRMLKNRGYTPCIVMLYDSQDKPWYVVQIGDYAALDDANQAGAAYKASSGGSYVIKSYDDNLLAQRRRCQ